jgi:hypothetical protein
MTEPGKCVKCGEPGELAGWHCALPTDLVPPFACSGDGSYLRRILSFPVCWKCRLAVAEAPNWDFNSAAAFVQECCDLAIALIRRHRKLLPGMKVTPPLAREE